MESNPEDAPAAPMLSTLGHAVVRQRLRAALLGEESEPIRVDRFGLERELGQGGMGTVWLAHDEQLGRRVALKFLRHAAGGEVAEQRLFAEAQGLAKISHPNVVPVYDVGRHEGRVWVAMEFVPGRTLRRWVEQEQPRPRRRLEAWLELGRGLAEVHAAGLVHRDVKPDNAMMGDDGRVRLLDFGLVRGARAEASEDEVAVTEHGRTMSEGSGSGRLTRTQQFVGTPAYAAPEQRLHGSIDARVDQFAFCVSVWEALSGARPRIDLVGAKVEHPGEGRLRARVGRALRRGLSWKPEDRFPSMDALLAALEPPRRVWLLPTLTALIAGCTGLAFALRAEGPEPCAEAGTELAETWNEASRDMLQARFPEATADRAEAVLDEWTSRWAQTAVESCEDVLVRQLYSTDALDRRGLCLERAHQQLATLLDAVDEGELTQAASLTEWLGGLDDPERCSSPAVMEARAVPAAPEHRAELAEGQRRLERARLGTESSSLAQRIAEAERAMADAERLGWPPLAARAASTLGELSLIDGRATEARAWFGHALDQGQALRDLELVAKAQHGLARVELLLELDPEAAQWRLEREAALVHALGDPPVSRAILAANQGDLSVLRGDLDGAERALRRSIDAWEQAGSRHGFGLATSLRQLADVLDERGRRDEVPALLERARSLEQLGDAQGAPRSELHEVAYNEGVTAVYAGDLAAARARLEKALQAAIERQGARGRFVATVHVALAGVCDATGDLEAARHHAVAAGGILAATVAPDHPERTAALGALAIVDFREGRFESAAELYRRALSAASLRLPPESPDLAAHRLNLGETLLELGREAEARRELEAALEIFERSDHPYLAVTLKALGGLALRVDEPERARTLLLRAESIFEATPSSEVERAEVLWRLAQAEAALGSRSEARARAEAAAGAFEALGESWTERVNEIRAWHDAHDDERDEEEERRQ